MTLGDPRGSAASALERCAVAEGLLTHEDVLARAARPPGAVFAGWFLVAHLDGEPVGCVQLSPLGDLAGEVRRAFVVRWARRRGVARRLLGVLEDRARTAGFVALRLEAGRHPEAATAFYEALGYRRLARCGPDGEDPTDVRLAKLLVP